MSIDHPKPARALAKQTLLSMLLAGLLLLGPAQVLRHLLGASHWHLTLPVAGAAATQPAPGTGWAHWLEDWRQLRQQVLARSPLAAGHAAHGHHHDTSERHHHAPGDATLVALEPLPDQEASAGDGASGSLLQPLGVCAGLIWRLPLAAAAQWPPNSAAGWHDAHLRLPERPPRA